MDALAIPLNPSLSEVRKILIVDDDDAVRRVLCEMLQLIGFCVVAGESADDALMLLDADPSFDMLLTDIRMPGSMDGAKLAATVRERYPAMPIMVTTGFAGDAFADLPEGIPILWKPFLFKDLKARIEQLGLTCP